MHKSPPLTAAQLIEARCLIVRASQPDARRRGAVAQPAPGLGATDGQQRDQARATGHANDPTNALWRHTEWSDTAFEPKA